jgi:acyl-CoA synthetase (AMP-forming)/AMP-acid ligase II
MKGYWQQPELTAQVLVDGFFRTGDLVSLREGFVYHHGRRDELIKVGGLGLFPSEVEAVLRAHPAVADAAVVPVQRGAGVVILKALVVPREGAVVREGELLRYCRRKLASFKVPREYEVVGALPRTATGKLRRFALPGSLSA